MFALNLEQQQGEASSDSYLISKFNLVDLAGSERAKRTKASGKLQIAVPELKFHKKLLGFEPSQDRVIQYGLLSHANRLIQTTLL